MIILIISLIFNGLVIGSNIICFLLYKGRYFWQKPSKNYSCNELVIIYCMNDFGEKYFDLARRSCNSKEWVSEISQKKIHEMNISSWRSIPLNHDEYENK